MRLWCALLLALPGMLSATGVARAGEVLRVCFGYGCSETVPVRFLEHELASLAALFAGVGDAAGERDSVAHAVGELYRVAGGQTPVFMDRGGNYADDEAYGRMDCIDHSTTTTHMLGLMARRGWLRFHEVVEPARRTRVFTQHFSARMRERSGTDDAPRIGGGKGDHVAVMLALCDCPEVVEDLAPRPVPSTDTRLKPEPGEFVVDSWFRENGEPAVVMPLAEWMNGEGPDVE